MAEPTGIEVFEASRIGHRDDAGIRSMLSADERALYFEVARRHFRGRGRVVELGTWLGSGTYEICRGLEETGLPWRLTALDRFLWLEEHSRKYPISGLAPGESFRPAFLANLAPFGDRIEAVAGDLDDIATLIPLGDGGVELLYVDAPKSWKMVWRVLGHMGPRLLPGAQVLFQDFFHITSRQIIWLALSVPGLRLTTTTATGTTALFEAAGPIADLEALAPYNVKALGVPGLLAVWDRAQAELPVSRRAEVAAGMALDLLDHKAGAEAEAVLGEGLLGSPDREATLAELDRLARTGKPGRPEAMDLVRIAAFAREGTTLVGPRGA